MPSRTNQIGNEAVFDRRDRNGMVSLGPAASRNLTLSEIAGALYRKGYAKGGATMPPLSNRRIAHDPLALFCLNENHGNPTVNGRAALAISPPHPCPCSTAPRPWRARNRLADTFAPTRTPRAWQACNDVQSPSCFAVSMRARPKPPFSRAVLRSWHGFVRLCQLV